MGRVCCRFVDHFWDSLSPCRLEKMPLSVKHKFLWYSILEFAANIEPKRIIVSNLSSWRDRFSIIPTLENDLKKKSTKFLEITEERLLFRCRNSPKYKTSDVAFRIFSYFSVDCRWFLRRLSPGFWAMSPAAVSNPCKASLFWGSS